LIHAYFSEIVDPSTLGLGLGQVVGNLGQGLGRADADRDRDAGVAFDRRPDQAGIVGQTPALEPGEIKKRLVDAVELDLGGEGAQRVHDAAAHVAVEGIIAGEDGDAVPGQFLLVEVVGVTHGEAEGFGLVTAGDDTAVIVRQHDDRAALQSRAEHALTADVEIVTVGQGEDGRGHRAT
jgi:hypothetical protein